ncbi:MAG TPA: 30S ribosome-binding factor RbfA [Stellaceae bacterium]|nr:30S ribosome-binding factor RbfA [Stellaceae bacterium]
MARKPSADEPGIRATQAGQRQLRVGEELRHALARLLRPGELRDPALFDANVTVTEVRISPDLRNATAFVMPLGGANAADIIAGLRRSAPYLKGQVAKAVRLRRVPHLGFQLDSAFESAERIATLLHSEAVERDLQDGDEAGRG